MSQSRCSTCSIAPATTVANSQGAQGAHIQKIEHVGVLPLTAVGGRGESKPPAGRLGSIALRRRRASVVERPQQTPAPRYTPRQPNRSGRRSALHDPAARTAGLGSSPMRRGRPTSNTHPPPQPLCYSSLAGIYPVARRRGTVTGRAKRLPAWGGCPTCRTIAADPPSPPLASNNTPIFGIFGVFESLERNRVEMSSKRVAPQPGSAEFRHLDRKALRRAEREGSQFGGPARVGFGPRREAFAPLSGRGCRGTPLNGRSEG